MRHHDNLLHNYIRTPCRGLYHSSRQTPINQYTLCAWLFINRSALVRVLNMQSAGFPPSDYMLEIIHKYCTLNLYTQTYTYTSIALTNDNQLSGSGGSAQQKLERLYGRLWMLCRSMRVYFSWWRWRGDAKTTAQHRYTLHPAHHFYSCSRRHACKRIATERIKYSDNSHRDKHENMVLPNLHPIPPTTLTQLTSSTNAIRISFHILRHKTPGSP